ncbi:MAG TPA: 2,3-diaminopropionate biosynthesis protein SbnA [Thermoanaerobaculia bacterium]|nr:2,3-diaminopropionate biosynthesis protein SbnA [Thermoanaerobaculia bacterium]
MTSSLLEQDSTFSLGAGAAHEGVLSAVGRTPLVRLRRIYPDIDFRLYAKLEALNPGGSIKDRPAREILQEAMRSGAVGPGTVIVESSSGNMGIGLAQACACFGLRFICVVDAKASKQNIRILEVYGAEIDYVAEPDPETGEFLPARLNRVKELLGQIDNAFWPNQYANEHNSGSHHRTTMQEVVTELGAQGDRVDFVLCATSTCGTVRGCGELVRERGLPTRVLAVDALGSLIFSDQKGPRHLPGMGAGLRPPLCDLRYIDECVHVSDLECISACRLLIRREGIFAGASSGGLLAAVGKIRDKIPAGATCVVILPDRGERYLDTVYSDQWVREHFGEGSDLWPEKESTL